MILKKIIEYKKEELAHFKHQVPLEELKAKARDARHPLSLKDAILNSSVKYAIIAEIKKQSPSKGIIRQDFNPITIAQDYAEHGAIALSVLTDEHFFGGHLDYLREVRKVVSIPLLRKDFIWDPYQIYAALDAGADAILLIAAMLEQNQAEDLQALAKELNLSVLFEVHSQKECNMAQVIGSDLVGVNNRDLKTFKVDIQTSKRLFPLLSKEVIKISESGLESSQVLAELKGAGAHGFLIGESLMRAESPGEALRDLLIN